MAFGDSDIAVMFADMGQDCTVGGTSTKCYLDETDEILLKEDQSGVMGAHIVVTVPTADASNGTPGASVVVGSTTYTVIQKLRIGDGALTKLLCTKA
jgi:hypothetical protein